jgi:hypothetical protein
MICGFLKNIDRRLQSFELSNNKTVGCSAQLSNEMKDVHQTSHNFHRCQSNAWPEGGS